MYGRTGALCLPGALLALVLNSVWAQSSPAQPQSARTAPTTSVGALKQAYEAAWARQPESHALALRRDAAAARREIADSWTADPPALEVLAKTDRLTRNQGSGELEVGVALPLWLRGERAATGALAEAELRATESRVLAAQLGLAASVRDAYWQAQRARLEVEVARERVANASLLAVDVARRAKAGDLSRADQHQADGATAAAEVALADAQSTLAAASARLRGISGADIANSPASPLPLESAPSLPSADALQDAAHPAVRELLDRAEVGRRAADLAALQKRANPELIVGTTRERGAYGESYQQTITVGVRFPFGSDSRYRAKVAAARAEQLEAESRLGLERQRLVADLDGARLQVESARAQVTAAERRAQLARESRGFFQRSFQLGETDLPTRLRIDLEAFDADRQAARARIELGRSISQLRQSLGLLPE